MKKIIIILASLFVISFSIYKLIFIIQPTIEIVNNSSKKITRVECYLPSSRIVMDEILPFEKSKILYKLKQKKGIVKYSITLEDGVIIKGKCGITENYNFGNRIKIELNNKNKIICTK
jgi:hypothetical protein